MKLFIFLIILSIAPQGIPGASAAPIGKDRALMKLKRSLPKGWDMKLSAGRLVIQSRAMVWVLFQNMINAPATTETMARRNARIRKHGKKMHSALVFRLEKRWSPKKLSMARQKNRLIQKKSAALIAKHGLTAIFYGNSKLGPEALAERKGLGKAFARYQKERRALIRSIVSLPQFHSQHYSLWLIGTTGASGQFALIYPHAVSAQNYAIRNLLPKILTPAK